MEDNGLLSLLAYVFENLTTFIKKIIGMIKQLAARFGKDEASSEAV